MKNRIQMRKVGNVVEIKIVATSEEMADKFFDFVEQLSTAAFRFDLEETWKNNNE